MRLLVDDRWLGIGGIGRFATEVLARLRQRDVEIVNVGERWRLGNPRTPWLLRRVLLRENVDVFWSPGYMPPAVEKPPFLVTLHDLLHRRFHSAWHKWYYDVVLRPLVRRAFCILTVSEFSRRELLEWLKVDEERVAVAPNGVSDRFRPDGERVVMERPYIVYVGNRRKHKNLPRLLKAFKLSGLQKDVFLALSGGAENLGNEVSKLGLEESVRFLGEMSEEGLANVYRGAVAVACVSLSEGFGLPVLEGMACGVPVVAARAGALPEVAGDAALLVDPYSEEDIALGLRRIVEDGVLREQLRVRGIARAAEFTWERTEQVVWERIRAAWRGL